MFGQPPPRHNGLAPRRHRARPYSRKTVLTRHLGAGSCGSVYVGMCGDEEVAVKVRRDAAEMRPEMRPQMRPRCGPRWGRDVAEIGADTAKIANGYLSRRSNRCCRSRRRRRRTSSARFAYCVSAIASTSLRTRRHIPRCSRETGEEGEATRAHQGAKPAPTRASDQTVEAMQADTSFVFRRTHLCASTRCARRCGW